MTEETAEAPKIRKPLDQLISELESVREACGKTYLHRKSGQSFQLLFAAFDERTNELLAVYCLIAYPRLKFTRPMAEFHEKFEAGHG